MRFRSSSSSLVPISETSIPSTRTDPESGAISPTTCFNKTDFPVPLRPMITTDSPGATFKLMPRSTCFEPRRFDTFSMTIGGSGKEHPEQERSEQIVHDQDEEARRHDRVRGRHADPLRAPFAPEPVVAAHHR